jgi:hypothetical protein
MVVLSRTIMSDIAGAFFFLLGVWLLVDRGMAFGRGGLALGFAVSVRLALVPSVALVLLYALRQRAGNTGRVRLGIGLAIGALPVVYYAVQSMSLPVFAYGRHDVAEASLANALLHVAASVTSLNIVYPLMLILGLIPRYRDHVVLKMVCASAIILLAPFPGDGAGDGGSVPRLLLVLSQRYCLFAIGPILIGYCLWLHRRLLTNATRFLPLALLLGAGVVAVNWVHQGQLARNYDFHRAIYRYTTGGSLLIVDDRTVKLIQDLFGERDTLNTEFVTTSEELYRRVESHSGKVYLVYLRRQPAASWPQGDLILERYVTQEVGRYTDRWELRVFRVFPTPESRR